MPIKFLYTLPKSARLAYPHILAGVRRGMSVSAIERSIRAAGLPISRARTLTPLVARLREIETRGRAVRSVARTEIINTELLPESVTDIRRRFSYQYRQTGIDRFGKQVTRNITVTTDNELLTRRQLDNFANRIISNRDKYEQLEESTLELEFGIQRGVDF